MKKIFFLILGITLSIAVVMNKEAVSQDKQAPKIRIGEFTGSSGETVNETESNSPKGLTDSDVEFMYRAGLFDEEPGFFRQRISVAYNLFYISNKEHLAYEGGVLVEKLGHSTSYSHGIAMAIQYHCGVSFTRDFDWRGNPLLGVNLLLDGSFGSTSGTGNIQTLGIGGEVHFLWICKIAVGSTYVQSENRIFKDGYAFSSWFGRNITIKDKKSATLPFYQAGISFPVSNKFDVFALASMIVEDGAGDDGDHSTLNIYSYRAGVAWKF